MSRVASIGGKEVIVAEPYTAPAVATVGRHQEMRLLTAAWMASHGRPPLSPLLVGEPGAGKNALAYELARRTRKRLYIFQGHEDVTVEDLACTVRFSDDAARRMDYVASPLVTAMLQGEVLFFDEIAKCRPRALAALVSVCDERRSIDSTLLGERIQAHPGFRLIAATNSADLAGHALPDFLRSRLRPTIPVACPSQEDIQAIVHQRYATQFRERLVAEIDPLLTRFWAIWREREPARPPTPRDVIHVFDLALNLADFAAASDGPIEFGAHPTPASVEVRHLEEALGEFFRLDDEVRT
jgi:MoxR-like ATPase